MLLARATVSCERAFCVSFPCSLWLESIFALHFPWCVACRVVRIIASHPFISLSLCVPSLACLAIAPKLPMALRQLPLFSSMPEFRGWRRDTSVGRLFGFTNCFLLAIATYCAADGCRRNEADRSTLSCPPFLKWNPFFFISGTTRNIEHNECPF